MKIPRRQRTTHAVSIVLSLLGVTFISFTIWRTWPTISSAKDPLSTFMAMLGKEKFSLFPGFEYELIYLFALGDMMLISGVVLAVLSVQWLCVPGEVVFYRCPFCNKDWRSKGDKALVHCPNCGQLVHPTLTEKRT